MKLLSWALLALAPALIDATELGYSTTTPSTVNGSLSFGSHYAVLNLDLITALVGSINTTTKGQAFIKSTGKWINAVHRQNPPPISIFSRIYFSTSLMPEVSLSAPFYQDVAEVGNLTESDELSQLYPAFKPLPNYDVVLQKTRYYAGTDNTLVQILRNQKIDTVVLVYHVIPFKMSHSWGMSGLRTSGVMLTTALALFDLDFNVYVIANNTIETGDDATSINNVILQSILPKMPLNVITVEQAIDALSRSNATYY
ncbi:cysteine hydrolase family protein [Penicillium malachiteum]|uniref:cysteine hydrolase family protein n=1 Tax=Penicillium malachiteum TaxID=1324776 RepID=UPI002546D826|nr:cysteine hydrolase family protein [Penicillium malachiteum]KAJ5720371.1 cysteine hydrolase family protein [Penicillium malachiteum]